MASLTRSSASIMDSGGLGACSGLGAVGSSAALVAACPAGDIPGTAAVAGGGTFGDGSVLLLPPAVPCSVAGTISPAFWRESTI